MIDNVEVAGGADPLVTAAILAAVTRLEEERTALAAAPRKRPLRGRWVLSGRPREVAPPIVRPAPNTEGWSVTSDESEGDN
ncbi:MAG: hypothetical protein IH941_06020 [Acidobacteria bacterium]|nr:hypothetical protein [Acidobacteriota bacterium]